MYDVYNKGSALFLSTLTNSDYLPIFGLSPPSQRYQAAYSSVHLTLQSSALNSYRSDYFLATIIVAYMTRPS